MVGSIQVHMSEILSRELNTSLFIITSILFPLHIITFNKHFSTITENYNSKYSFVSQKSCIMFGLADVPAAWCSRPLKGICCASSKAWPNIAQRAAMY
jgi:hypothetical protein